MSAVTLKRPSACGGDVSWCTAPVSGYTIRYRLFLQVGATCSAGTGVQVADDLTSENAFPRFAREQGCGCVASLQVDLP